MPDTLPDIAGDPRLECNLDPFRRPVVHAERVGERRLFTFLRFESLLGDGERLDSLERESTCLAVFRHEGNDIQRPLCEHHPVRVDGVFLLPVARERVVPHHRFPVLQRGVEQLADLLAARGGSVGAGLRLGLHDEGEPVEEAPHPGGECGGQALEGTGDILLKRGGRQALDKRAAEVEGTQFGKRESCGIEAPERVLLERPVLLPVVRFVEQRKPCRLQRLQIPPDRARRHAGLSRHVVDGEPARGLQLPQDRPLPDHLRVAWHGTSGSGWFGMCGGLQAPLTFPVTSLS